MTGLFETATKSAIISPCTFFRYRLEREVQGEGIVAAIIGVNPSKADAEIDDQTIRKDMGFARRNGWRKIIKGNKFAFRATDVDELKTAVDPVGPDNSSHLWRIMADADVVVAAWGPLAKLPRHLRHRWHGVVAIAKELKKPLHCFGTAQDGQPRHTLMLAYDTPLTLWELPR